MTTHQYSGQHMYYMKLVSFAIFFSLLSTVSMGQLFSDDFDGANPYANWDTNTTSLGALVGPTVENHWVINNSYTGITTPFPVANTPAQPATMNNPGANYLHILSRANEAVGATNAGYTFVNSNAGDAYFTEMNTDINTTGLTNVFLEFWYLNEAEGAGGNSGQVFYSVDQGVTWLATGPQYAGVNTWTQTSIQDPAFDNQANLRFGFLFTNPLTGTDPAFSIDEIVVDTVPGLSAVVTNPTPVPTTICLGSTINFNADDNGGAITQFQWNFGGANTGPQTINTQAASFTAGTAGNYNFRLIVGDGTAFDTLTFAVNVTPCNPPTINFSGNPTQVCQGSAVTFTDNSVPGSLPITQWDWNFDPAGGGNGGTPTTFSGQIPPPVTYNTLGTYDVVLTLTDGNGTYSDTLVNYIEVVSCPVPVANFQANSTRICPSDCINFIDQSANMGAGGSNWLWSFPGSDSSSSTQQSPANICYQTPGSYDVQLIVSNTNGTDTLLIEDFVQVDSCLAPEARITVERDSICQGTCIQFFNNSIRTDSSEWVFFGADVPYDSSSVKNPIVCYSDTGTYDVQLRVFNQYGVDILYLPDYISVAQFPEVVASDDKSVYVGNSVQLEAFGTAQDFVWTPDYNISCTECRETTVTPLLNTVYYVTNTNTHGCSATDSVRVEVDQEYFVGVPDIFSPNGDGQNDVLKVKGNGIEFIEFYVYDRFGQLIFESREQSEGWDGRFEAQEMLPGVYVYYAKVTLINGRQEIIQGDVTLIR